MAKKNYLKKNKDNIMYLFMIIALFVVLSLVIPAIGVGASSPALWVSIVIFFESIQTHFAAFWMFYSFIAVVFFAYINKK